MTMIDGRENHIGWIAWEKDSNGDEAVYTYCLKCELPKDGQRFYNVLYSDDFKGDKFRCESCGQIFEFDPEAK